MQSRQDPAARHGVYANVDAIAMAPLGSWTTQGHGAVVVSTVLHGYVVRLGTSGDDRGHAQAARTIILPPHVVQATLRFTFRQGPSLRRALHEHGVSVFEADVQTWRGRLLYHHVVRVELHGKLSTSAGSPWQSVAVDLARLPGRPVRVVFHDWRFGQGRLDTVDLSGVYVTMP